MSRGKNPNVGLRKSHRNNTDKVDSLKFEGVLDEPSESGRTKEERIYDLWSLLGTSIEYDT